jgi:hypothetical protein
MIMARVPIDLSIYDKELSGRRSWMIGSKKEKVFPEPV